MPRSMAAIVLKHGFFGCCTGFRIRENVVKTFKTAIRKKKKSAGGIFACPHFRRQSNHSKKLRKKYGDRTQKVCLFGTLQVRRLPFMHQMFFRADCLYILVLDYHYDKDRAPLQDWRMI